MSKQDISIQILRPGMHVVGIDVSWLDSPFLRHSFRIESTEDIRKLKTAGVKIVTIERSKSDVLPEQVEQEIADKKEREEKEMLAAEEARKVAEDEQRAMAEEQEDSHSANIESEGEASLKSELGNARRIYSDVKQLCARTFKQLDQGESVEVEAIAELAQQTTESLVRNNQAIFSFLLMQRKDRDLHNHAFSVFSLVLALAHMMALSKEDRETLALAALIHDVGWLKLPLHLLGKGKPYIDSEKKLVGKHPLLAARMVQQIDGVNDEVGRLIALHHERPDGSGYPLGHAVEDDILWSILVVADRYDELVHQLLDQPGMVPKTALKQLYIEAQKGCFDIKVVQCLVTLMGVYPISSAIELKSGEKAVVTECHRSSPSQPRIRIYYDTRGQLMKRTEDVDLSELREDHPRQVAKAIDWRLPGVDPAQVLNITEADLR